MRKLRQLRQHAGTIALMATTVFIFVAMLQLPSGVAPLLALALAIAAFLRGHDQGFENGVIAGRSMEQSDRAVREAMATKAHVDQLTEHYRLQRATDPVI